MSTIKVNALRHTGGSSDNINLDSSGRVLIGASSSTANTAGDDLQIVGSSDRGLTITSGSSSSANIYLGDDGDTDRCRIAYQNGDDALDFSVNGSSTAVRIDSSANLRFNSGYGSVATAYGVRAWINFDGSSGSIGTGDANGNISGVTDLGTGDYTIAIDNDMPDANYVIAGHVNAHQAWGGMVINARADGSVGTKTAGSFSLATIDGDSARDYTDVGVLVIR